MAASVGFSQRNEDDQRKLKDKIDTAFIPKWAAKFPRDQDYFAILNAVRRDMKRNGGISKPTFEEIIRWKAARLLGKGWVGRSLHTHSYEGQYGSLIKAAHKASIKEKIFTLTAPGVGAPVASTILHFMYPRKLPIIDVRTVEALNHFGYIGWLARARKNYQSFAEAMNRISKQTGFGLRTIDQALFAFHKQRLRPHKRKTGRHL